MTSVSKVSKTGNLTPSQASKSMSIDHAPELPMVVCRKSPWITRHGQNTPTPFDDGRSRARNNADNHSSRSTEKTSLNDGPSGVPRFNSKSTDVNDPPEAVQERVILSICWNKEKLGAAFFDVNTRQIYVMEDKVEMAPDFYILKTLFSELTPRVLVVGGRQDQRLFKVLQELCKDETENQLQGEDDEVRKNKKAGTNSEPGTSASNSNAHDREALSTGRRSAEPMATSREDDDASDLSSSQSVTSLCLIPASDFKYEFCKRRVITYSWPSLTRDSSETERSSWIRARVDLDAQAAIRALGGLMKFLKQRGSDIVVDNGTLLTSTLILGLHPYVMEDLVEVDEATILGLQIFAEDLHPATAKSGKSSSSKEGLSLFAILSRTASPLSSKHLRMILHRPVRDASVLTTRYDFIQWALQPVNFDTVKTLQSILKNITSVQTLFSRLQRSQLSVRDWKTLYRSIFNSILLAEICEAQDQSIQALSEVCECASEGLYRASYLIQRTLDFDQSDRDGRFVVKPGLDLDLDDKKRRFHCLGDIMHKVAELELVKLPQEIESCCVIYLPHVGYLLALPPDSVLNLGNNQASCSSSQQISNEEFRFDFPGLQFRFTTSDMVLFKSELCEELDNVVGDLQVEIANRETSIMIRLIEEILGQSHGFLSLVNKALMVDVLLAFTMATRDFGWVRPEITSNDCFLIEKGRHPIYELCNPTFVSNDTVGNKTDSPVVLITGPNASGKTVYIRQIGVIAYLAHLGCFVPADKFCFKPFDSIAMVAAATPSVVSGLSCFMVELNRMAAAIYRSTYQSLVLVDEFGISTCEDDGASLLAATINFWTIQKVSSDTLFEVEKRRSSESVKGCPLVFISTHFLKVFDHLSRKNLVKCMCMETIQEDDKIIPLYQISEGRSQRSYALQVAQAVGLPSQVIQRAKQVGESLQQNRLPPRWDLMQNEKEMGRCKEMVSLFLSHDIASLPINQLISALREHLNESSLEDTMDSHLQMYRKDPSLETMTGPQPIHREQSSLNTTTPQTFGQQGSNIPSTAKIAPSNPFVQILPDDNLSNNSNFGPASGFGPASRLVYRRQNRK